MPADLKWTSQFSVSAQSRSRPLPGDKVLLPPSALEQLLAASSSAAAENARRDLPRYDPYNSTSYSAYRQAESQYEDRKDQLPYPLMLRLVNPGNGKAVYAGIQEFSAQNGEAVLSSFLLESLGIEAETLSEHQDTIMVDDDGHDDNKKSLSVGPKVTVHAKELAKGTFVKLRPLEAGYNPEDWKALLEQHLRANYTTLTNGEVLLVQGGRGTDGKKEEFRFLIDGFKPEADGICVVDTDLEVDIEALNEEQARETLKQIASRMAKPPGTELGSSPGGDLDLFKVQEGQVRPGEYIDYQLTSWNRAQPLDIELDADDDDEGMHLLVSPFANTQRARPRMDEFVFADLDMRPRKRIRLESTNVELEHAEELHVSVHAYNLQPMGVNGVPNGSGHNDTRRFTLCAKHPDVKISSVKRSTAITEVQSNDGDVLCKNCNQWVPQRTLILHENFCLRNNLMCPEGCGQIFQRRSTEYQAHWHCPHDEAFGNSQLSHSQHDSIFHPPEVLRCQDCGTSETFANVPSLARHRTTTCPAKLILCRFCHLVVPQEGDPDVPNAEALLAGMTPHELSDGARTTECHLCNKIVRLRDMETHLKNHDLDRLSRQMPVPCRNVNCGRTLDVCSKNGDTRAGSRMGQGPGNDIGLCSTCFGPLYVSMYDPENKALRRRIERRYLQQLVTGCGKLWCKNEFCKSGRKNLALQTNITTKDALPIVKPFLEGLSQGGLESPLHFCVEEKSQKRRNLAQLLAAEDGGPAGKGGFSFEWCIGALEAESGDLDGARSWLKHWAPARAEQR